MVQRANKNGHVANGREQISLESVDDRMISLMRLILAFSALCIIYIEPSEPDRLVAVTYVALVVYTVYSAVLYLLSLRRSLLLPAGIVHWVDVGCYLALVALSSGTSSIFFFFFFFAILVASFRWGFGPGLRVTVASALLFTVIGYATAPAGPEFELNRFLLRPIYLVVLGYMIAYWGGREIRLKRRLGLLKEITRLSNPRFGVSHTIGSMLQKLQTFYDADGCLLVMTDLHPGEPRLFRFERGQLAESVRSERIPPALAQMLLSLPEDVAVTREGASHTPSFHDYAGDLTTRSTCTADWQKAIEALASKLEMESFVSVPLQYRGKAIGRLYLTARRDVFDYSDVDFLMLIVEQIMPVIHNIRLLSRLSSNAAEQERQRLARDIHDSVIQPYIGLQYKVAAVRNKFKAGAEVAGDIEQLFQMTVDEVNGLRGFVSGLKGNKGNTVQDEDLLSAVRRFAAQFGDNYELEVQVESRGEINVSDRLAAELIKIIHEGLSNVRKHTEAAGSRITLERADSSLQLCIENNDARADGEAFVPFTPVSITERVEELGGSVCVEQTREGSTVVKIDIPI